MKKYKWLIIGILGILVFAVAIGILIKNTSIYIDNYTAYVNIDSNGDMEITETWIIDYPEGYNVRFRDIEYSKDHKNNPLTKGLNTSRDKTYFDESYAKVYVEDLDEGITIDRGIDVGYSFNGDLDELLEPVECAADSYTCESIFVNLSEYGGMEGKKAFHYTYKINGAVTQYSDISELNWVLFDMAEATVKEANVEIHLPSNSSTKEEILAWGHGVTEGNIYIENNQNIYISAFDISTSEELEIRVAFPNSVVSNISNNNIVIGNMKEKIVDYETDLANRTNLQIKMIAIINTITIALIVFTVIIIIRAYRKYDKEYKSEFNEEYLREPPSDITPAEVGYLYNFGKSSDEDVTATLLNLVHKGILDLKDKGVGITDDNPDFDIVLNDGVNLNDLLDHEKVVIDLFINKIGDGKTVNTQTIKNYGKSKLGNANTMMNMGEKFSKTVKKDFKCKGYFENAKEKAMSKAGAYVFIHIIALIAILSFSVLYNLDAGINIIVIITLIVIYAVYLLSIKRRSKFGNEEYTKWCAFKNFLESFSDFSDYPLPSIVIWEKYLVYATSLKIADKVMKQLKVVLPESLDMAESSSATFMRGYYYGRRDFFIYHSINHSYSSARINSMNTIARYNASSGGGRGGGFSGGSSFGGGGGGGRSR